MLYAHDIGRARQLYRWRVLSRSIHEGRRIWQPAPYLTKETVECFREEALLRSRLVQFRISDITASLPASKKWFTPVNSGNATYRLDEGYLSPFASTLVPLEFTSENGERFTRVEAPLRIFLDYCRIAESATAPLTARFYLAQASLSNLPDALRSDLPTPEFVSKAGAGDVYDANLWMGLPPTNTPLHRDPNPNFFIQLAGKKLVRILPPAEGDRVFAQVQKDLDGDSSKAFRGQEMMVGKERTRLEEKIWDGDQKRDPDGIMAEAGYEVSLEAGQGIFIPQGWWHAVKGIGGGISASVNWWFR